MRTDIDQPYQVSIAEVEAFRRDGFVRLKDVFTAEELEHYGEVSATECPLSTHCGHCSLDPQFEDKLHLRQCSVPRCA